MNKFAQQFIITTDGQKNVRCFKNLFFGENHAVVCIFEEKNTRHNNVKLDENIICEIGKGNENAFYVLYETINLPLFSYIFSIVCNKHDAEDILQETYLKIKSAAHLYTPQGKPMAWIFRIAKNLSLMHIRGSKRLSGSSVEEVMDNNKFFSKSMDEDDRIILEGLMKKLDEETKSIILLHTVCGYKYLEIAKSLEMPLSTVLSKYHRGIKKLKAIVENSREGK